MAIAGKLDKAPYRVFTLLGDGELAEGSNWEAAMAAAHYRLDNLVAILDRNRLQITAATCEVMASEPVEQKWRSFGWEVRTVDGHNLGEITSALGEPSRDEKPVIVIANTVKGKGISFMENVVKWHHGVPSPSEMELANAELDAAEATLLENTP
jgi:transketolase